MNVGVFIFQNLQVFDTDEGIVLTPLNSVWLIGVVWFRVLIVPPTVSTTGVARAIGQSDLEHILNISVVVWLVSPPSGVGECGVIVGIAPDI